MSSLYHPDQPTRRIVLGTALAVTAQGASAGLSGRAAAPSSSQALSQISVREFGVTGSGDHDDTAALQRAHDAAVIVHYPAGTYRFSTLTLRRGGIVGDGRATVLKPIGAAGSAAITHMGSGADPAAIPYFRDFSIIGSDDAADTRVARTTAIRIGAGTAHAPSLFARMDNIKFRRWQTCLDTTNASAFRILDCDFFFYADRAIVVGNGIDGDAGDSLISGCHFFNGNGTFAGLGTGILQRSSGGLRVLSNKFNGGRSAYTLELEASTSILVMVGNSIEHASGAAVRLTNLCNRRTAPIRFAQLVITGNQFARNSMDISIEEIAEFENMSYWDGLLIANNVIFREAGNASISIASARDVSISNNVIFGNGQCDVRLAPSVVRARSEKY